VVDSFIGGGNQSTQRKPIQLRSSFENILLRTVEVLSSTILKL